MKYIAVAVIIALGLLSNFITSNSSILFPGIDHIGYEDKRELSYCTDRGAFTRGFPFRTNHYDECSQDDGTFHLAPQVANFAFWTSLTLSSYFIVMKLRN